MRQDGPSVFRWAVWEMAKTAKRALEAAGLQPEDLAAFVPHQANMRIIDEMVKQLKLPESVVVARDIAEAGNTSAASIPWPRTECCRRTRSCPAAWPCRSVSAPAGLGAGHRAAVVSSEFPPTKPSTAV